MIANDDPRAMTDYLIEHYNEMSEEDIKSYLNIMSGYLDAWSKIIRSEIYEHIPFEWIYESLILGVVRVSTFFRLTKVEEPWRTKMIRHLLDSNELTPINFARDYMNDKEKEEADSIILLAKLSNKKDFYFVE